MEKSESISETIRCLEKLFKVIQEERLDNKRRLRGMASAVKRSFWDQEAEKKYEDIINLLSSEPPVDEDEEGRTFTVAIE